MEATAIGESIQHILDHDIPHSSIFSDSKSALKTASGSNPSYSTSHLIFKISNLLFLANQNNLDVSLIWIPGHVGVDGNEIVDVLAKNGSTDGPIFDLPLTHTDIWASSRLLQCSSTIGEWIKVSETRNAGQYYFKNFFDPNKVNKPWFSRTNLCRNFVVTISRLRTNHYSLAASLARKNFIESEECPHCGLPDEDINHVLWACPKYSDS